MVPPPQAFELATGDYLFEPHSGEDYSRDEGETIARAGAVRTSRVRNFKSTRLL